MAVQGVLSITLDVPDVTEGLRFYTDAGLMAAASDGDTALLRCAGHERPSIVLRGGASRKQLNHITLRCDRLEEVAARVPGAGGEIVSVATVPVDNELWLRDPHGMLIHLIERPAEASLPAGNAFEINSPGRIVRTRRSAMLPVGAYSPVRPLRMGHVMLFSPNVPRSVAFMTEALGMGLADRAQDVIAFCCARRNSDHHVVAFAKSAGIGFHHASFLVADPDEVGRGGRALLLKAGKGDWGFGRHTIGSNFFHYIQDPWGSWFEYYSDIDYISDYSQWTPTNYGMEDSLDNWGPELPKDFVHNYETDAAGF